MNNITLENYYKKAVKNKYEEIKDGDDFIYLNPPTRGKLNKFCWEIFETNKMHSDDLVALNSLLGLPFDLNTKNKFRQQTNQFRPIETFFKGETDPEKIDVVDLAAILVDFQPRPFAKFRKQIDEEDLKLINELRDKDFSHEKISSGNFIDEVKVETCIDSESNVDIEESEPSQDEESELMSIPVATFVDINDKPASKKMRYLGITAGLVGLGIMICLLLLKKDCIQWSGDHYEEVSCDLKIEGIGTFNSPEPYDERIINLRKIKVCDTTTCFDKNGTAIIWYAKNGEGVDYFNTHGMHPENGKPLRPVTKYILEKYKK